MTLHLLDIPVLFGFSVEVYFILLIIAIPTFLFWRWLLKKRIKVERTRKIATWCATLIVTPIIYVSLIILLMFGITYTPSHNFDKSRWLADKEGRFEMASDIINSKMLIDKDSSKVKEMLGEPTWGSNSASRPDTLNTWNYDMGMGGGGLGFMFHNLIVKFDKGKVVSVDHRTIRD